MKPLKHTIFAAAAVAAASMMAPSTAMAANVDGPAVFWKLSTWGKSRAFTRGVEHMAERLAEETGGKFQLKVFYGEQLSKNRENLDGLKSNAFEAAMICNFYHPGKNPALMVLTMPFLPLTDFDTAARVRSGIYEHPILKAEMAQWNAMLYASSHLPQYEFMGRGDAPVELEGWKGLRVRAGGGLGLAMEKLGATRQSMPATEVYTAIQRGTADAVSFPSTYAHAAYKIDEVADWYTTNLAPGTTDCPIVLNATAYEKLPPQYQDLLMTIRDELPDVYKAAYAAADEVNAPRFAERLQGVTYDEATIAGFRKTAGEPVWNEWVESNKDKFDAQAVLDRVLELAASPTN